MAKYVGKIKISSYVFENIQQLLNAPDSSVGKGEVVFDQSYTFSDGRCMAIQVCASLEPSKEACWSQAILMEDDYEVACSEPSDVLLGEWCITVDGNDYVVEIIVMDESEDSN